MHKITGKSTKDARGKYKTVGKTIAGKTIQKTCMNLAN
jgi:hypothetical protein